ncbi:MAG TPA: hypothetical protein VL754_18925 [Verrucomicrobiae bacterium]|nr:hypothetical protein [Verrucomicrobiae bacterium]
MVLAARGARNLDKGEQKIDDEAAVSVVRKNAGRIHLWSMVAAAIIVVTAFLIAGLLSSR